MKSHIVRIIHEENLHTSLKVLKYSNLLFYNLSSINDRLLKLVSTMGGSKEVLK